MTLLEPDTRSGNDAFEVSRPKFNGKELTLSGFHLETVRDNGKEMTHHAPRTSEFA
jgi:hypothetical protein